MTFMGKSNKWKLIIPLLFSVAVVIIIASGCSNNLKTSNSDQVTNNSAQAENQISDHSSQSTESGSVNPVSNFSLHESSVLVSLASIHMVSDQVGWATGQKDPVLRTDDGGATWCDVTPLSLNDPVGTVMDLTEIDPDHAWLAVAPLTNDVNGYGPIVVYRTEDGGKNWQKSITSVTGTPQIRFLNDNTGFIMADQGGGLGSEMVALLRSGDGGENWKTVTPGTPDSPISGGDKSGFGFANAEEGYVAGTGHGSAILFYVTHDGGKTWQQQTLPIPHGYTADGGAATAEEPVFFGQLDGVLPVAFHQMGQPTVFYFTHDDGGTWTPTTGVKGGKNLVIWSFADMNHGFATDGSVIYRTTDAGQHWTKVQPNISLKDVTQLDFRTSDEGWAIVNGRLLKTTDGGRIWSPVVTAATPQSTPPLYGIVSS